jgi:hypothetical protein
VAASGGQFVSGEVTEAVFGTPPCGVTAPAGNGSAASVTTSTVADAPAARSPSTQVNVVPSSEVQASSTADTNVRPVGRVSVTVTAVAGAADPFVTVIVYGTWPPGTTCVAVDVLAIEICGWSGVSIVDEHTKPPVPAGGQFDSGEVTDAVFGTSPSAVTAPGGNGSAAWVITPHGHLGPGRQRPQGARDRHRVG